MIEWRQGREGKGGGGGDGMVNRSVNSTPFQLFSRQSPHHCEPHGQRDEEPGRLLGRSDLAEELVLSSRVGVRTPAPVQNRRLCSLVSLCLRRKVPSPFVFFFFPMPLTSPPSFHSFSRIYVYTSITWSLFILPVFLFISGVVIPAFGWYGARHKEAWMIQTFVTPFFSFSLLLPFT